MDERIAAGHERAFFAEELLLEDKRTTAVASHLIQATRAAALLGAESALTKNLAQCAPMSDRARPGVQRRAHRMTGSGYVQWLAALSVESGSST
ncbi:hypothetical protein [Sorangium sp. So ce693]|uniref:hypothetical protein n=1 Tax=Sorangium sp. So ce693 TaxID=3133318 RepID=UPI003F61A062